MAWGLSEAAAGAVGGVGTDLRSGTATHEWTLKRNCSMSPRQFATLIATLAGVSVAVASIFAYAGAWWILFFACVEVAALAAAFIVYATHAGDYERIVVTADALVIESISGTRVVRQQAHPAFARVEYPYPAGRAGGRDSLIGVAMAGRAVEVGRFVPRVKRAGLAREIRARLQAASSAAWK